MHDLHPDVDDDIVATNELSIGTQNVFSTNEIHFADPINPVGTAATLCSTPQKVKEWKSLTGKLIKHFQIAQGKGKVFWPKSHRTY